MIQHRFFPTEPWVVRETELDLSVLAQTESIFASLTGTSGCGQISRRASLTACQARTSTASTRRIRCSTPSRATATRMSARRWSTSPTAR